MKSLALVCALSFALLTVGSARAESIKSGAFGNIYKDSASGTNLTPVMTPVVGAEYAPTGQTTAGVVASTGTASHTYTNSDSAKSVYIYDVSCFALGKIRCDIQTNVSG